MSHLVQSEVATEFPTELNDTLMSSEFIFVPAIKLLSAQDKESLHRYKYCVEFPSQVTQPTELMVLLIYSPCSNLVKSLKLVSNSSPKSWISGFESDWSLSPGLEHYNTESSWWPWCSSVTCQTTSSAVGLPPCCVSTTLSRLGNHDALQWRTKPLTLL